MNVVAIVFGLVLFGAGGALAVFAGIRMSAAQDPDITVTNPETGQSAQMGKSGLLVFIVLGILLAIAGIVMLVNGFRA